MTTKLVVFSNNRHRTQVTKRVAIKNGILIVTKRLRNKINKELCGISDCMCGRGERHFLPTCSGTHYIVEE